MDTNYKNCSGTYYSDTILNVEMFNAFLFVKILMNVMLTMEVVNRFVLILNHPISVHAVKDSDYINISFVQVLII